jgi:hypothetical protein
MAAEEVRGLFVQESDRFPPILLRAPQDRRPVHKRRDTEEQDRKKHDGGSKHPQGMNGFVRSFWQDARVWIAAIAWQRRMAAGGNSS